MIAAPFRVWLGRIAWANLSAGVERDQVVELITVGSLKGEAGVPSRCERGDGWLVRRRFLRWCRGEWCAGDGGEDGIRTHEDL